MLRQFYVVAACTPDGFHSRFHIDSPMKMIEGSKQPIGGHHNVNLLACERIVLDGLAQAVAPTIGTYTSPDTNMLLWCILLEKAGECPVVSIV
jgi:hypothetical protein